MGKKTQIKSEENGDTLEDVGGESSKGGKKSKKSKKKDFDEDDIQRELEELSLEVNGELPASKEGQQEQLLEKKEKKSKKDDNGSDMDSDIRPTIGGDDDDGDTKSLKEKKKEEFGKPEKNKKEKMKKKSKRKGNDDDEEDIEEILAQIESEYRGEKREEKKPNAPKEEAQIEQDQDELSQAETKSVESKKGKRAKDVTSKKKEDAKQIDQSTQNKEIEEKSSSSEDAKKKEKKKIDKEDSPKLEEKAEEGSKKKKTKSKTKEEKKKEEEEEAKARKGKPNKKMLEAMKQMLAKQKEEEERRRREMEERQRQEEERLRQLEEERRLEEERKERQRQKQKERQKRLKEEGKLLTPKQKLEQKRVQAMLAHLKAQGVEIPEAGARPAPTYKKKKKKQEEAAAKEIAEQEAKEKEEAAKEEEKKELESEQGPQEEVAAPSKEEEEEDDVIDAWDELIESDEEEESSSTIHKESFGDKEETKSKILDRVVAEPKEMEESESENEEHQTEAEKRKERAALRMAQRKAHNEKNKSLAKLRSPVVCVLGHVDHGKTKILDKLRRTNVQEGEVGGITQQIGATNVPFEAIKSQTRMVKDFEAEQATLPGLLIIDTPGHESFSNLRSRGSSLCDIAILVVDVTQGLEPQTIESINLLKTKKTPFVVALNKVDRIFEWESYPNKDIREIIKLQNDPCKNDFDRRTSEVIRALNIQGLNAALFWENPDPRSYVSLVPTSAISGDGMGNLMALITTMCQKRLASRLMFSEELQCTVLEVKTIQGHGTTIDVILVNGRLREGDTIVLAGTECPIVTQIRSLLIPKPMKEIRVKGQYDELKEVQAALGVKIAARDLEKAIAGLNLQVAHHDDEVDFLREQVDREFKAAMRSIKVKDKGVYVQASTLGALEALLEFFKANKVPYAGIRVGPVVKRDVMKAAAMLEHDPMYAVILAFDVKVERDAQELADKEGIKIFSEETIYHLGDRYVEYIKDYKKKKQDEFRHVAVFPCKLKILPDAIFNKRDPIVLGVTVDAGILRTGTPLCVPSKEFVEIGVVTSLEFDHKTVEIAKKGVNVCIKIEPLPGHTPKLFGRHFDAEDVLISKISRDSIDACKQYFRDDLGKTEWKLMVELKKDFGIL